MGVKPKPFMSMHFDCKAARLVANRAYVRKRTRIHYILKLLLKRGVV